MNIACIGCGLYAKGITSLLLENKNNKITMWVHDKNLIPTLESEFNNPNLKFSSNILDVIENKDIVFILTSSTYFEETIKSIAKHISSTSIIYIGTKGKLKDNFYNQYTTEMLKNDNVYSFAGPSLAKDIYNKNAVGFTVAPYDKDIFKNLFSDTVNVDYLENSEILEIFSIYKNIVAIGSGMIMELTNSYSSVLTYLTKAYQEINEKLFNNRNVVTYGSAGDFYLTGTMLESRNYAYGKNLVIDKDLARKFLQNNTVEGYDMLNIFISYLISINVEISIITILDNIINKEHSIDEILSYLKRS